MRSAAISSADTGGHESADSGNPWPQPRWRSHTSVFTSSPFCVLERRRSDAASLLVAGLAGVGGAAEQDTLPLETPNPRKEAAPLVLEALPALTPSENTVVGKVRISLSQMYLPRRRSTRRSHGDGAQDGPAVQTVLHLSSSPGPFKRKDASDGWFLGPEPGEV